MDAEDLDFLEERLDNTELYACDVCQELTLHTHEEVLSIQDSVTEVLMRCTECMSCRTVLLTEE